MSDKCDYSMEKYGDDQYQDFCERDNRDSCPIYRFWKENH